MLLVCEALQTMPPMVEKEELLQRFNHTLAMHAPAESKVDAAYRLTCSAVVFSRARHKVWIIGDCQFRYGGSTFTHGKKVDEVLAGIRREVAHYLLAHGHTEAELRENDLARAFIADALHEQTNFQNDTNETNPYRYPVLDGTVTAPDLVPEYTVSPEADGTLILASDGYPTLCDTLAETEAELQRLLLSDPLCIGENAATKGWLKGQASFDDRAYLRLVI